MKILHTVEFYPPSVGGMQEVVRQLSEGLAQRGHDVTVATGAHPDRTEAKIRGVRVVDFAISGNAVDGYTGPTDRYRQFLLDSDFDVMANFAAQQWATDLAFPLLPRVRGKKVFVPTGFSLLFHSGYRDYFANMKSWLHQYDMNVFLSNDYRDIEFARSCGVTRLTVIPNGASEEEFSKPAGSDVRAELGISRDRLLILHVGSHTGLKGHTGLFEILRRARIRKAALLIVGNEGVCAEDCRRRAARFRRSPRRLADRKQIVVRRLTRAETVAAYQQAAEAYWSIV